MTDIKPIRTEVDYEAALDEIARLFDSAPGTPASDRLEVLTTLVEHYEERHHVIPIPDPIEALRYHMESRGLAAKELEPLIGTADQVKDVLTRRRPLSMLMIRRLHDGLGISADVLIQQYPVARTMAWRRAYRGRRVRMTWGKVYRGRRAEAGARARA